MVKTEYYIAARTHKGYVREINQDNLLINGLCKGNASQDYFKYDVNVSESDRVLIAVFDGMGGLSYGEIASDIATKTLRTECWEKGNGVLAGIESINEKICEKSRNLKTRMGSTCVIIEKENDRFRCWNIGDSRAYLFRHGELMLVSKDHKDEHHKHALSQYLGISPEEFIIEPYASEWIDFEKNDFILLCSDGLYGMVSEDKIVNIINQKKDIAGIVNDLEQEALAMGGKDNVTIIGAHRCG